jgi:hypothetical protein
MRATERITGIRTSSRPSVLQDRSGRKQVYLTRVGLKIPTGLSFEDWERAGHHLSSIVDSSSWCLGDWLVYGKQHYADRYEQAIRAARLRYQTLRNYAWVSRRFELSRRRSALSFQHHAEVASMSASDQDYWLDQAERHNWTTGQLRNHLRGARTVSESMETSAVIPRIAVQDVQLAWWRMAASRSGMEFETWVTAALDGAAARAIGEDTGETPARRPVAPAPHRFGGRTWMCPLHTVRPGLIR